jgi:iron-sulfur cluster assembly accessory protein
MSKNIINVTTNAWKKMGSIIQKSNNKNGFIFGANSGGCNGFNFDLRLIEKEEKKEIMKMKPSILTNNDVNLYIEPLSEMHLIGTTVDYINEDFSKGIFENKFVYKIDKKLASSCGCGVSFMPRNLK